MGFIPYVPLKLAGILIDPPPSLPVAKDVNPAIMEAAAPPLDPPDVRSGFHGFLHESPSLFSLAPNKPNSGV